MSGALCDEPMRNLNGDVTGACIVPPECEGDAMILDDIDADS